MNENASVARERWKNGYQSPVICGGGGLLLGRGFCKLCLGGSCPGEEIRGIVQVARIADRSS